jgi:hypothetical protein
MYLGGRRRWPTIREWEADGMLTVRSAIKKNGGLEKWCREYPDARHRRLPTAVEA